MPRLSPVTVTITNWFRKKGETLPRAEERMALTPLEARNLCRSNDASPLTAATTHCYGEKPIRTITALTHYQFN